MANHEVWVRVVIVGVTISGKRVGGAEGEKDSKLM